MTAIASIAAVAASGLAPVAPAGLAEPGGPGFSTILQGLQSMETKIANADAMVKKFALDDSVPVHQVTYALEEARLSIELAMQVRSRLVEAYRDLMNMQL